MKYKISKKTSIAIVSILFGSLLLTSEAVAFSESERDTYRDYLTNHLVEERGFDENLSILGEGRHNFEVYYIKTKDSKGNKGTFYLHVNSLKVYDHPPKIYELYNVSKKIDETLFRSMKNAKENEKLDIGIQFNDTVSQTDVERVRESGAVNQRFSGTRANRSILASATKQQINQIATLDNVQLIVPDPLKPEGQILQEKKSLVDAPIVQPQPRGYNYGIFIVFFIILIVVSIYLIRRRKNV